MSYTLRKPIHKAQGHEEERVNKMSAGFSTAYYDILSRDLRNVYGGVPPSEIKFRTLGYHRGIDVLDRIRGQHTRSKIRLFPRKYMEYLESYDICIPRAPAFRNLPKSDIDHIVKRLYSKEERSFDYHHQMSHQRQDRSQLRSAPASTVRHADHRVTSARGKEKRVRSAVSHKQEVTSKEHMTAIVERLYQGQTHQSQIKQRQIVLSKNKVQEKSKRCKSAPATGAREK